MPEDPAQSSPPVEERERAPPRRPPSLAESRNRAQCEFPPPAQAAAGWSLSAAGATEEATNLALSCSSSALVLRLLALPPISSSLVLKLRSSGFFALLVSFLAFFSLERTEVLWMALRVGRVVLNGRLLNPRGIQEMGNLSGPIRRAQDSRGWRWWCGLEGRRWSVNGHFMLV
ncbi:hypothetical protein T439DRAFT_320570 [Meredithblackwellia eburnea MCA 4105]